MPGLLVNLDVDDMDRGIQFYTDGLGLRMGRRFDDAFVELLGADVPMYLLHKPPGSSPFAGAKDGRTYARHWTGVHLDFVVDDIEAAIRKANWRCCPIRSDMVSAYSSSRVVGTPSSSQKYEHCRANLLISRRHRALTREHVWQTVPANPDAKLRRGRHCERFIRRFTA
jgi:catechol 2,3-dioxygenase-like lactoylglutathione lyase family enzyme